MLIDIVHNCVYLYKLFVRLTPSSTCTSPSQVVYRGYVASQSLQATHDDAVQTRTHLRLRTEAEEQEQKLQEFKLKREKERTKLSKQETTLCLKRVF